MLVNFSATVLNHLKGGVYALHLEAPRYRLAPSLAPKDSQEQPFIITVREHNMMQQTDKHTCLSIVRDYSHPQLCAPLAIQVHYCPLSANSSLKNRLSWWYQFCGVGLLVFAEAQLPRSYYRVNVLNLTSCDLHVSTSNSLKTAQSSWKYNENRVSEQYMTLAMSLLITVKITSGPTNFLANIFLFNTIQNSGKQPS